MARCRGAVIAQPGMARSTREAVDQLLHESRGPAQTGMLTRLLRALTEAMPHITEQEAGDLAGEESNYAVLLRLLEQPEVLAALRAHDHLAAARVRGLRARDALLAQEGGTISAGEAATL